MRCLNQWIKSVKERIWLRKFVRRMIGGRESAILAGAFHHYKRLVEILKTEGLNMKLHTIVKRCEFLEEKFMKEKMQNSEKALRRVK